MDSLLLSTVIIGYGTSSTPNRIGSGFFALRNNFIYLITCEHIFQDVNNDQLFFIPIAKQRFRLATETCKENFSLCFLSKPHFHPSSTDETSYDVAVFTLGSPSEMGKYTTRIKVWDLDNCCTASELQRNILLKVEGYPENYREFMHYSSENHEDPDPVLSPYWEIGQYLGVNDSPHETTGFNKLTIESYRMLRLKFWISELTGISGGVVSNDKTNNIYGICTGQKNYGLQFTDIKRAIETIDEIEKLNRGD